jgi:hypothetical protein
MNRWAIFFRPAGLAQMRVRTFVATFVATFVEFPERGYLAKLWTAPVLWRFSLSSRKTQKAPEDWRSPRASPRNPRPSSGKFDKGGDKGSESESYLQKTACILPI